MAMKWKRSKEYDRQNERDITVYTCEIGSTRFVIRKVSAGYVILTVASKVAVQLNTGAWVDQWCFKPSMRRAFETITLAKEKAEYYLEFGTLCGR